MTVLDHSGLVGNTHDPFARGERHFRKYRILAKKLQLLTHPHTHRATQDTLFIREKQGTERQNLRTADKESKRDRKRFCIFVFAMFFGMDAMTNYPK